MVACLNDWRFGEGQGLGGELFLLMFMEFDTLYFLDFGVFAHSI